MEDNGVIGKSGKEITKRSLRYQNVRKLINYFVAFFPVRLILIVLFNSIKKFCYALRIRVASIITKQFTFTVLKCDKKH